MEPPVLCASGEQCRRPLHLDTRRWFRHTRETSERVAVPGDQVADVAGQEGASERLEGRRRPDERRMGEHPVEPEPPNQARTPRSRRLHLLACGLHHPAERDVRRTHVLARPTHEAGVHQFGEPAVGFGGRLVDRSHRGDPSPGGLLLLAGQSVGGAVGEAETARDAGGEVGVGRRVASASPCGRRVERGPHETHPVGELGPEDLGGLGHGLRWYARRELGLGRLPP